MEINCAYCSTPATFFVVIDGDYTYQTEACYRCAALDLWCDFYGEVILTFV